MSLPLTNNNKKNNVIGHVAPGWESLRTVFEQHLTDGLDIGGSVCVYYQGECVVDLCGGWKDAKTKKQIYTPDTLQLVFSVTKGVTAAALALCVEKGWLDYQAPVARYWPEFGANGKQDISVSDLLSHRAGLSYVEQTLTADDAYNWDRMTSLLAAQKPHWEPGSTHGYHTYTFGFLAGELIRRVDLQHRSCGQFIRDELDHEFYVGVSDDKVEARVAPLIRKEIDTGSSGFRPMNPITEKTLTCSGAFPLNSRNSDEDIFNDPKMHRAELPAVGGITNARTLARIYALLIGDLKENDEKNKCLLSKKTLALATENVTPIGELDQIVFGMPTRYARGGFQLHGDFFHVLSEDGFGHKGLGGSLAFASPSRQLAFAHVCNQLDLSTLVTDQRSTRFFEAIKNVLEEKKTS